MGKLKDHLTNVVNRTWNFAGRLQTVQDHQQNALTGLATEAAEALDVGKKMWWHHPKNRRAELRAELGDVLYYLVKVIELFGFTLEEILEDNKQKLYERHKERFDDEFSVGH